MGTPPARAEEAEEPQAAEASPEPSAPEAPADAGDELEGAGSPQMTEGIEEMLVRDSTRDDLLKDLSVSVTSFSASDVKSLRIQNIADLSAYTPNLEINTAFAASNPTLFIRGIGLKDYNANAAGAVAVYQDGVNINSPAIQLGQLFDVGSIEVLRGPQGSINGRNATAGAIMVNSVLPDDQFDTSASFTYGNFNNIQAEGAVTLPLIDGLLSTRAAFTANFRDGTTRNRCAEWDPEKVNKPPLTEEYIRQTWEDLGRPTLRPSGQDLGRFPRGGQLQLPDGTRQAANLDTQGRILNPDGVCIWDDAGFLDLSPLDGNPLADPTWFSEKSDNPAVRTVEDFRGLNTHTNNVDNWAGRGIVRFQPDVLGGMDWILNAHGGQNRGDSQHLQMLRTQFQLANEGTANAGETAFIEDIGGFSEVLAGGTSGFEGSRKVDGLAKVGSGIGALESGGRGGDDPDTGYYDRDGREVLDTWGLNLKGRWDLGPFVLNSLTAYDWYERTVGDEGDASPLLSFPADYEDSAWQVSQEVRVGGEGERYRWFLGFFYLQEELDSGNSFAGVQNRRVSQEFSQKLMSLAPYANGRVWLLEEVSLDAGVRYNWEHKDFALKSAVDNLQTGVSLGQFDSDISKTWTAVTGDVTLAWQPNRDWMYAARLDNLNLYAKYGRGFKGGHFNAGLTIQGNLAERQRITPVDPEFIDAVEVGVKSRWLQDRLTVDAAVFRYWYKDLQVFDITNERGELPIQQLLNSDASVLGAEVEIQARPLPGLLVQAGGGWLDTEFLDFTVTKAVGSPRGTGSLSTFDYSGNPLIAAPEWNFSGVAEYQIPLFGWGSLVPQYDFSYSSKVYLDPQGVDPISQDPYWQHNARLAYRSPDGRLEIAGWVENFMDERYKIDVFDQSIQENTILEVWNDPRTYGITVSVYW